MHCAGCTYFASEGKQLPGCWVADAVSDKVRLLVSEAQQVSQVGCKRTLGGFCYHRPGPIDRRA